MKLASFQKVTSVEPIEGADKIVKIVVNGHELVTQKTNNLKEGDLVCYFEVDTMLPLDSTFSWLASNQTNSSQGEGYRITPRKTKGILSDGLCLPISYFEEMGLCKVIDNLYGNKFLKFYSTSASYDIKEGVDLTKGLNAWKFEEAK